MTGEPSSTTVLSAAVVDELRAALPAASARTVAAVTDEIPEYGDALAGTDMAAALENAVGLALGTFLRVATGSGGRRGPVDLRPVLEAAHALGRGEARTGRTIDALLGAYRVGARTAWEELSAVLVARDVPADAVARFAALVFAYIDELSSASVAGHQEALAASGRTRERLRERLAVALLGGEPVEALVERAVRAGWEVPATVTAVVVRAAHAAQAAQLLDSATLRLPGEMAPDLAAADVEVLLVPDAHRSRPALLAAFAGRPAVVGPTRPWSEAVVSYRRVLRLVHLLPTRTGAPVDADDHLLGLVVSADPDALADLRARALAPLDGLRPAVADRLVVTLRAWLLHGGRRDDVAAHLGVHPQTVRYRMAQLREHLGDRLNDPAGVLDLVVALAVDPV